MRASHPKGEPIDRPFDPAVVRRAADLAAAYRITLRSEPDAGFVGECVEMPLCLGVGETPDECVRETRGLVTSAVATMLEDGLVPPPPLDERRRDQQVNVRLTLEEKLALEEAARQAGFRGVSEYVRNRSLAGLRA